MAHRPVHRPWPKGRPRVKVAKQTGYRRPTNAGELAESTLVRPLIEELAFRLPVGVIALFALDWAIVAAVVSTVAFVVLHRASHGSDIIEYAKAAWYVYLRISVTGSFAVIIGATVWGFTGLLVGLGVAVALHVWNNLVAETEEYSQREFRVSHMGEARAFIKRRIK